MSCLCLPSTIPYLNHSLAIRDEALISAVEVVGASLLCFFAGQAVQLKVERPHLGLDTIEKRQLLFQLRIERCLLGLDVGGRAAIIREVLAIILMIDWMIGRLLDSPHRRLHIISFSFALGGRCWWCCEDLSTPEFVFRIISELVILLAGRVVSSGTGSSKIRWCIT